ncbi:MAG: hypothetical protein IJI83_06500 [Oscillospiraceae bacterium]|nr:hypothetical protein [Erysipelotrichaceae bacterium]MBQ6149175.1 hypothetical protein [Oscillospiraceae bacterium]MBQ6494124.1 hypothetical protein [Erysipelotrichaceae bacterium]
MKKDRLNFLSHINTIENTSIYTIADECFVSRSSVQRFIKNIGYDSYTLLKNYLKDVISHENALIYYIGKDIMISSRNITMSKNVYTTYGLTFFFDLFYHGCYVEYNRLNNKGQ